jgi:hypothetical protein
MHTWTVTSAVLLLGCIVSGCGSSGMGTVGDGGGANANCTGAEVPLTVKNFESWCTFKVNGASTSSGAEETVCVTPSTVDLMATANSGFVLGSDPWHDTTTQSSGSATVTVGSASMCVWVCCPGVGGSPACPTTDQCP